MDLKTYGLFPYQRLNDNVSLLLNIYWTLLTLIDPMAIVLFFFYIDLGLLVYALVLLSDVIVNYCFMISTKGLFSWINFGQINQLIFLIFYLATAYYIHKKTQEIGKGV